MDWIHVKLMVMTEFLYDWWSYINLTITKPRRGDTHITSTLGCGGVMQKWDVIRHREGVASALEVQSLFVLLKKIEFAPWTDILLIIYYWQEIFLLTMTSDSEAIL